MGSSRSTCLGLQKFFPLTQSLLVFAARSYGGLSSWLWNPGLGGLCGARTPHSQDIPPEFLSITRGCGTRLFCVSAPPTSLDGCGLVFFFFNRVVVRLPFNLISDGSE